MDFKELQYVMSIAKHHNITKAAAGLYISQPSLSKYLQNLEANLGLKLFTKKGNYFELTYAGERYLAYANEIMLLSDQLHHELDHIRMKNKGRIRIALPMIRSSQLMPKLMSSFQKEYPEVEVELLEQPDEIVEEMLLNKEADLGIFHQKQYKKELIYEVLKTEEIVIAVPKDHELTKKAVRTKEGRYPWIDFALIRDLSLIGYDQKLRINHITETILSSYGIIPKVNIRTASIEGAVRMASEGIGVCFVNEADLICESLNLPVSYLSFGTPCTIDELVLAYSKEMDLSDYDKKWMELIRSAYLDNQ